MSVEGGTGEQAGAKPGAELSPTAGALNHDLLGKALRRPQAQILPESLRVKIGGIISAFQLPTAADELWRYTQPENFALRSVTESQGGVVSLAVLAHEEAPLPAALEVRSPAVADKSLEPLFMRVLSTLAEDLARDAWSALQLLSLSSATVIRVPRGVKVSDPLLLRFTTPREGVAAPLVIVQVERGAALSLVEDLQGDGGGFLAPRIEFLVEENASLDFHSVQRFGDHRTYLARHRVHALRDARAKFFHVALGSRAARVDFDCILREPGADVKMFGVYLGDGKRHLDFHPSQLHLAPNCTSNLFYKGVIKERAHTVYYGFIRVAENAQQTNAYQANRNLLLSSLARADSIPNLEIKANDVKCSHGASVGQLGEEELFYLMSRGLNRRQAEKLLVDAFFEEILLEVKHEEIYRRIHEAVFARLQ